MNSKAFLAAVLALALLPGCHRTTHITREDQLAHMTDTVSATLATETISDTSADTTALPTDTTGTETTAAEEEPTVQQTEPTATKATKPASTKATTPPETTVPEMTGEVIAPTGEVTAPTAEDTEPTVPVTAPTEPVETEPDPYDISGYSCGSLEYGIAEAINSRRREAGLPELSLGQRLSAITSVRAYESSVTFSHTRPDGRDCFSVLGDYGKGYGHAGENLLQCSDGYSAADMVELWMGSAGHRANILDPEVTNLGVGVYRSCGMVYVATIFTD